MLGCWDHSCFFETSWENEKKKPKKYCNICFQVEKQKKHSCVVSWKGKNNHYSNDNLPLSLPGWTNEDQNFNTPCLALKRDFNASVSLRQMTGHLTEWKMQQTELTFFTSKSLFSSPPKKLRVIPRQLTNPHHHLPNHDLPVRLIRRILAKWRAFNVGASSSFTYSGLITGDKYRKDSQAEIDW